MLIGAHPPFMDDEVDACLKNSLLLRIFKEKLMKNLLLLFLVIMHVSVEAQDTQATNLKKQLDSVANKYGLSSIGYALVKGDSLRIADAVGVHSLEKNEPVDQYSVYRIGSITKSFVALGIMKLAEEGKIDLHF